MKKLVLLIVALLLVLVISVSAEGIDLSGMSDEDLCALEIAIVDELGSRGTNSTQCFFPGEYIVGDEIDPGRYVFTGVELTSSDGYGYVVLREDATNNDSTIDIEQLFEGDKYSMKLSDGNLFKVDRIVVVATRIN